jgi:hypothetical protein
MSEREADRSENGKAGTVVPHPTEFVLPLMFVFFFSQSFVC